MNDIEHIQQFVDSLYSRCKCKREVSRERGEEKEEEEIRSILLVQVVDDWLIKKIVEEKENECNREA